MNATPHTVEPFHANKERCRLAAENAGDTILILNSGGMIVYANHAARAFGYQPAELRDRPVSMLLPAYNGKDAAFLRHLDFRQAGVAGQLEAVALHRDGGEMTVEISLCQFQQDSEPFFTCIMRDITERKKREKLFAGQNQLLEMVALGAPLDDLLARLILLIESLSPGMRGSILLLDEDGVHMRHGAAPSLAPEYIQAVNGQKIGPSAGSCGTAMHLRERVIVPDLCNHPYWAPYPDLIMLAARHSLRACWSTPIFSSDGRVLGSFAMYYAQPRNPAPADLKLAGRASHIAGIAIERQRNEQRIRHMAHHDALTGLPNRLLLEESLNKAIAHARRQRGLVALLFIDLDNFKGVNDSLGHHVGDLLLQAAARRLQSCVRSEDMLARLGGDEFVIVLTALHHTEEAAVVAQKALKALDASFNADGHELHTSGSVGISLFPNDGQDAETLMREADAAMYHAKECGRGNFRFFTQELNDAVQHRLHVENQLRRAIAQGELTLHYQPQVDLQSNRIYSAEALLRWSHPQRGLIPPEQFIAIAEESGLILQIGEWALREACAELARWHAAGHEHMSISVNLSARQIFQPGLADQVARILHEFRLPATALDLEITETMLMRPGAENMETLTRLSDMGIRLSVDDFGIGYSSLSYLKRFPIDALKIDRSFVSGIGCDQNDTAITSAIIGMANGLNLKVVAEGVETAEQASFLKAGGCGSAQGYYYGMPQASGAFAALL